MKTLINIHIYHRDTSISRRLKHYLTENGCAISCLTDSSALEATLALDQPDLLVLEHSLLASELPDPHAIRVAYPHLAMVAVMDRAGPTDAKEPFDDVLVVPFTLAAVHQRLRQAWARRRTLAVDGSSRICFGPWSLDTARRIAIRRDGAEQKLTLGEFQLLQLFLKHPRQIITRDRILHALHPGAAPYDRTVDVKIRRLREKLEDDPGRPRLICTVRGAGYMFSESVTRP